MPISWVWSIRDELRHQIVNAVLAERERSGVTILAEGIETAEHVRTAQAMGATVGQGWLLGRPEALPHPPPPSAPAPRILGQDPAYTGTTPYEALSPGRDIRRSDKALLLAMSLHLEHEASRVGPGAIILSAFQDAARFTPKTMRRYERLAATSSFVVALGVGNALTYDRQAVVEGARTLTRRVERLA
ncbi:MAG: EAL domain-containing protein [Thermoleophilaceae bacterium]|nr:EAL domain-containing protein [Thermoleophilaceae bacterium]